MAQSGFFGRAAFVAAFVLAGASAQAEPASPVVVELFTSQGCSSCPPADALLHQIAAQDGVIALSLHVDYWDYIGWEDSFARKQFTKRQKAYARAGNRKSIYTPQIVVGGEEAVIGHHALEVQDLIQTHGGQMPRMTLTVARAAGSVTLRMAPNGPLPREADILLVRFMPRASVEIERGENAGRIMDYVNVVTDLVVVGSWSGAAVAELKVPVPGEAPAVVLVQEKGPRRILAAARVN